MPNHITPLVNEHISKEDTVLDVCAGIGTVMDGVFTRVLVAADIYKPYLDKFRSLRPDIIPIVLDARKIGDVFLTKSFDVVTCIDGVEHLEEQDAIKLLDTMESIARKKVVIFTPNGYTFNNPQTTWGIPGGDNFQKHLSGLTAEFYEKRGYSVARKPGSINPYDTKTFETLFCVKTIK